MNDKDIAAKVADHLQKHFHDYFIVEIENIDGKPCVKIKDNEAFMSNETCRGWEQADGEYSGIGVDCPLDWILDNIKKLNEAKESRE